MMRQALRSLRVRLLMVQLAVVAFGVLALLVTVQLLAPAFFGSHLESMSQMMDGTLSSFMETELREAFESSFGQALAVSVAVSVVAAVALSTLASRRILAPLESVREAARRMAGGSYSERVHPPQEIELAMLAKGVNALAEALDTTEQRRFFRVDPKASAGTGIGLTIARSIVRRHGGEITAESPGLTLGSVFRVQIPLG